jgi:hypothetical protein
MHVKDILVCQRCIRVHVQAYSIRPAIFVCPPTALAHKTTALHLASAALGVLFRVRTRACACACVYACMRVCMSVCTCALAVVSFSGRRAVRVVPSRARAAALVLDGADGERARAEPAGPVRPSGERLGHLLPVSVFVLFLLFLLSIFFMMRRAVRSRLFERMSE